MNKTKPTHGFVRGIHLFVIAALLAGLALGLRPMPVARAAQTTFDFSSGSLSGLNTNQLTQTISGKSLVIESSDVNDDMDYSQTEWEAFDNADGKVLQIVKGAGPPAGTITVRLTEIPKVIPA